MASRSLTPIAGPPIPSRLVVDARTTLECSVDPVEIVTATLALRDMHRLPVGGGMALSGHAEPYARDIVDVLDQRGFLVRQGRML